MKWGRKKPLSSSSSSSSLISHVFPIPWLSKFKNKNTSKSEPNPRKPYPKGSYDSPLPNPPKCPSSVSENGNGKLYSFEGDGDKFWRLSFGLDSSGEKTKRVGRKSKSVGEIREEEFSEDKTSFDLLSLKEMKAKSEEQRKSLYVSMEKQKKMTKQSNNNNNDNNKNRVRASSPKTASRAESCKVKALEDMKRSKLKNKKKMKKKKERAGLDDFAVMKSSYDPEKDFKDSMVEMIMEKKMSNPKELEELLACYLTLNSDDCHGLIIKVFREVWLELGEFEND